MRPKRTTTELSYESFLETFGNTNRSYSGLKAKSTMQDILPEVDSPKIGITGTDENKQDEYANEDDLRNNNRLVERTISFGGCSISSSNDSNPDHFQPSKSPNLTTKKRRLPKLSMEKLSSIGGAVQAAVNPRRAKTLSISEPATESKSERRVQSFLSNIQPYLARKLSSEPSASSTDDGDDNSGGISGKNPKPAVFAIPATRLTACAHKGFLDCRNKKKHWERYWGVLQDACLYCYHTPQSEITSDAILLRGYNVVADVTNLNRSRFLFRLQQQGAPTLHFSSDNHRDFLLWVGTLERETQSVNSSPENGKPRSFSEVPCPSDSLAKPCAMKQHRASMPNIRLGSSGKQRPKLKRTVSQEQLDQELLKMQKHKLLKEIAVNQQHIIEEQKLIDRIETSTSGDGSVHSKRVSKEQILDHYEKEKVQEELRTTKFLTLLNCRRNSAYLKVVQYTKDLSPKNGHQRSENHTHFFAMEERLKDMQEALAQIDKEVEEEEATKQHNLDKLKRKRDLELLIVEQQDAMDILRRNNAKGMPHFGRRHSSHDVTMTPSSTRSYDTLTSIDELSSTSEDHETTSTASSLTDVNGSPTKKYINEFASKAQRMRRHSHTITVPPFSTRFEPDPLRKRISNDSAISLDGDSGFQPSTANEDDYNYSNFKTSDENFSLLDIEDVDGRIISSGSDSPFLEMTSRESTLKAKPNSQKTDIDSSILAKIEDFELFAKMKLDEAKKS